MIKAYREAEALANGEAIPKGFGEMLADLNEPEPPLKSITDTNVGDAVADMNDENVDGTAAKQGTKCKGKANNKEDGPAPSKRTPRKRKTLDSVNSDATGTSAVAEPDNSTPSVSRRDSATRKRGAARGRGSARGSKRGRSASRASSTVTTTTMANDHDQEDFDDEWGRSIDAAITKEMLETPAGTNFTGTEKENSLPTAKASRPRPRKKQKVTAEAEQQ